MGPPGKVRDFDDMLQHVGSWGRFQITLLLIFFPFNLFMGYVLLSSILINFDPPHWCKVDMIMNTSLTADQRKMISIPMEDDLQYSKCMMYDVDWAKVLSDGVSEANKSWPQVPCSAGWDYDFENYHRTIVSDFDWVCENAWIPSLSQAIFFIGAIPGTLGFGYISDRYGRIPTIVASNTLAMISGILTPFVSGTWSYMLLRFLMGSTFNMFFIAPYILTIEYVDESKRTLVGNLGLALILTISGVYQPWLIKYLGEWKSFSWIIFGQMGIVAAVPWVMPESGRWLVASGKTERAENIMRKIAKINKKQVSEETFASFRELCIIQTTDKDRSRELSILDLFRERNIRKNTILMIMLYMVIACLFDASVRNVSNLNFSIYLSFMISTGLELPADLLSILGIDFLGRRFSCALSLGICGLCMFLAIPLSENVVGAAFFAMAGRFWATYAMNTGFQYSVEVMPTCLRGQGTALANIMSMASQIASPYIVYSSSLHPDLPFYLMGSLGVLGALPGLFLPETAGTNLPDTLDEAKSYGIYDKFFWLPFMDSKKRYKQRATHKGEEKVIVEASNAGYDPAGDNTIDETNIDEGLQNRVINPSKSSRINTEKSEVMNEYLGQDGEK